MWRLWRAMSVLGALIALAGVVDLIWIQLKFSDLYPGSTNSLVRWQIAMSPLMVVALGLIVVGVGYFLEQYFDDGDDDVVDDVGEPAAL